MLVSGALLSCLAPTASMVRNTRDTTTSVTKHTRVEAIDVRPHLLVYNIRASFLLCSASAYVCVYI